MRFGYSIRIGLIAAAPLSAWAQTASDVEGALPGNAVDTASPQKDTRTTAQKRAGELDTKVPTLINPAPGDTLGSTGSSGNGTQGTTGSTGSSGSPKPRSSGSHPLKKARHRSNP